MMNLKETQIKQHTMNWLRSFIIEYNICPFAKHVVNQGTLTMEVGTATDLETALHEVMAAIAVLDKDPTIETTLLIFPDLFSDFFDYLDFVDMTETLLLEQGYEGVYQLATFHPSYCFDDVDAEDASNYTNRSPYPMVHLLRESSLDKAIDYYGDTSGIPETNIATMRSLGLEKIKTLLCKIFA